MKGDLAENPLNSLPVVHGRGGDLSSLPLSSLFLCFPRDVWDWRWRRAGGRGRDMGWDGGCAGDSDRGLRETHRLLPPKFRNKFHGRRRRERRPSLILKASPSLSLSQSCHLRCRGKATTRLLLPQSICSAHGSSPPSSSSTLLALIHIHLGTGIMLE